MSKIIFDFLFDKIKNEIGVCALMGNLYVESKFDPMCLEGSYARKYSLTGAEYTDIFDRITAGEIDTFVRDGAGYGLAQWTYWSRKKGLWEYAQKSRKSVGDLNTQLNYLWEEIQTYKKVISELCNATSIREASDIVALRYEKPEHTEEKYLANRAKYGEQFYEKFKMEEKEDKKLMKSAAYVDQQIALIKQKGAPLADEVWEAALLCVGWPYIFGDRGEYCTPSHRRSRYSSTSPGKNKDNIKDRCPNFEGTKTCKGCKWFPDGQKVRAFDCRGYTYWVLMQFGIKLVGAGCTTQWNNESNWESKGTISSLPKDKLVCLFYPDANNKKVMEHTGFGYKGQTLECSNGVQHFTTTNKKWTHWAIPKGLYSGGAPVTGKPILRKGDKGAYVTLLQTSLLNRGYSLARFGADGSFGNETFEAVKQFQLDWGLTVDGIVGNKTWAMLESTPERQKLYTVTVKHLTREQAEELLKPHGGNMVLEE